jgi:hypothetical protein
VIFSFVSGNATNAAPIYLITFIALTGYRFLARSKQSPSQKGWVLPAVMVMVL